jgi:addiction module HigA family antidote
MNTTSTDQNETIPTPTIGGILNEEFLEPLDITPYRLAKDLHVATSSILDLIHGRRRLSVDMALRLSRYFGTSERFWLNLQNEIDIRNRRRSLAGDLEAIQPIESSA